MIRCGTFRHICRFQQSLHPRIQICACGNYQIVTPMGRSLTPAELLAVATGSPGLFIARDKLIGVLEARVEQLEAIEDEDDVNAGEVWEDEDNYYEPAEEPTGVIDREEYFWATYDYDDEDDEPPF